MQQKYQHTDKCKQLFHFSSVEGSFCCWPTQLRSCESKSKQLVVWFCLKQWLYFDWLIDVGLIMIDCERVNVNLKKNVSIWLLEAGFKKTSSNSILCSYSFIWDVNLKKMSEFGFLRLGSRRLHLTAFLFRFISPGFDKDWLVIEM